jgi:hypothetical protein
MDPAEEDVEPLRLHPRPARVVRQLVVASAIGWAITVGIALVMANRNDAAFVDELPGTAFVMGFLVAFTGFVKVFGPRDLYRLPYSRIRVTARFLMPGPAGRESTPQELAGGLSPGTVLLFVAVQLWVYAWFASASP